MDAEEITRLVPELLDKRYPGRSREAVSGAGPDLGWILDLDDSIALVRAAQTSNPFIWIRAGIAHAIPRTEALALDVAAGNKDLMVGRLYLSYGDDLAMVIFDEAILAASLSFRYQPSIQDLIDRLEMSIQYSADWTRAILEKFGGRQFSSADWGLMSF